MKVHDLEVGRYLLASYFRKGIIHAADLVITQMGNQLTASGNFTPVLAKLTFHMDPMHRTWKFDPGFALAFLATYCVRIALWSEYLNINILRNTACNLF